MALELTKQGTEIARNHDPQTRDGMELLIRSRPAGFGNQPGDNELTLAKNRPYRGSNVSCLFLAMICVITHVNYLDHETKGACSDATKFALATNKPLSKTERNPYS